MEGLPLLPGYSINDPSKNQFNVPHNFDWQNGYPVAKKTSIGIGGEPLDVDSVLYHRSPDPVKYDPSLTYGRTKPYVPPLFQPHFLIYSNKCLTFKAFFKQSVVESPDEFYRVRIVNIIYFLEDDSITVMEPKVENAGFMQGRLVKRARIPKSGMDEYWHWKDLNLGMDMDIYGIVYHICDCDQYTRAWLESQGIELDRPEDLPIDPYTQKRGAVNKVQQRVTPNVDEDKLKKYLDYDGRILRFYAVWDRRTEENGILEKYKIYYYLADDTFDIYEDQDIGEMRIFDSKAILKKAKIPKAMNTLKKDLIPIVHEPSDDDVLQFYSPYDLIVGKTVFLMGRRFYLYDCDEFTRKYYNKVFRIEQPKVEIPQETDRHVTSYKTIPKYTGFGSHFDSMLSYYHIDPNSANVVDKMDFIRFLQSGAKKLRYTAEMDYVHPEDQNRQFIIEYRLADGHMMIHEIRQRNSGFVGGRFLKHSLVPKPGTNPDNPEYFSPHDFRLGAIIEVYGRRFRITGVDLAVYRYMEANPEKFSPEMLTEARRHLVREGHLTEDIKDLAEFRKREEIAEPYMDDPELRQFMPTN
ncbi:EF-hand domain-containing protein 1 [Halyomorpha halys]|uniref:EF-hand domain-containing protein 1 n=1 Tax=Halyomorpha halys TaxID=286706 RepID=UPI0006D4D3E0|nr:EF-hand domain-containing protein 1-like [Halyomorpha halys]